MECVSGADDGCMQLQGYCHSSLPSGHPKHWTCVRVSRLMPCGASREERNRLLLKWASLMEVPLPAPFVHSARQAVQALVVLAAHGGAAQCAVAGRMCHPDTGCWFATHLVPGLWQPGRGRGRCSPDSGGWTCSGAMFWPVRVMLEAAMVQDRTCSEMPAITFGCPSHANAVHVNSMITTKATTGPTT